VQLVDEEDDVPSFSVISSIVLQPLLELAAVLRACHPGEIELYDVRPVSPKPRR
jgi:hypothetical protein